MDIEWSVTPNRVPQDSLKAGEVFRVERGGLYLVTDEKRGHVRWCVNLRTGFLDTAFFTSTTLVYPVNARVAVEGPAPESIP